MPAAFPDRSNALLSMTLDGQADVFAPLRFSAREHLSEPYEIEVTAVYVGDPKADTDVLQKPACVTLRRDDIERKFHGFVREFVPLGTDIRGYCACVLKIVPKLWALTLTNDCRIWQEKTAEDIVKDIFAVGGVEAVFRITGAKPTQPYRTQYNESGLTYARRILEDAGWYYFFEQGASSEKVVVTDANASLGDLGTLPGKGALLGGMRPVFGVARGKEKTADYNPLTPTTEVKGEQATALKATGPLSKDSFVWPAHTETAADAAARARVKMEAAEARASLYTGDGSWVAMTPGYTFEVISDDPFLPGGKYGIRAVNHHANDESWLNGGPAARYSNSFEIFPAAIPWREPLGTPRPRMDGVHAAIVIGGTNEHVHTDDHARIRIRFFWDHRAEASSDNGIWARVVQPWAGKGWGGQFLPRIGTEVAVAFMNGDPDHPVVLGGLYNGQDTPIFTKAENTKSGFRSRSFDTKAGGTKNFSEFSFDDKKGSEVVFLHAEKDLKFTVENDFDLKVDNCRIVEIKSNDTFLVKGKQDYTIKGNQTLTVEEGNRSLIVKKGNAETSVDMGNYKLGVKMGNADTKLDMGNFSVKAALGAVVIEAMQSITLKVGGNTVEISQTGVTIKGLMVDVKADAMATVASPMTTVKGDGMLTLKGGITMIN